MQTKFAIENDSLRFLKNVIFFEKCLTFDNVIIFYKEKAHLVKTFSNGSDIFFTFFILLVSDSSISNVNKLNVFKHSHCFFNIQI